MNKLPLASRSLVGWAILSLFALGLVAGEVQAQEIERIDQALESGWSAETSDGLPPIHCQGSIGGVSCSGKYCDNISILCRDPVDATGDSNWDDFFSEEGTNIAIPDYQIPAGGLQGPFNGDICPESSVVTGFACTGGYCDNISLECTDLPNVRLTSCRWTAKSYSEENRAVAFSEDELLHGVACFGKNCDNMKYYLCEYN
jgi:hypothetical protein